MVRPGTQGIDHIRTSRRVTQTNGDVPQPALIADAPDRGTAQALVELGLRPAEKVYQGRAVEPMARREIILGRGLREAVPGTDELAIVAAVDSIADERPQLLRYRALVLDREVGDAAPGVELIRTGNGPRRADVDAALARAAVLRCGGIDRQRQVGVDLAQEKPGAAA